MTDAAEAIATADDPRGQVARVLKLAAESALTRSRARCGGSSRARTGRASAAPSRSRARLEVLPMTGLCTPCQWMAKSDHPAEGSRTSSGAGPGEGGPDDLGLHRRRPG